MEKVINRLKKISSAFLSLPLYVRILIIVNIILIIAFMIPKFRDSVVRNSDEYMVEKTRLETTIALRETEIEKQRKLVDSLRISYNAISTKKEITNITNYYSNEKIRIYNLPIDSTIVNLSKWLSETTVGE